MAKAHKRRMAKSRFLMAGVAPGGDRHRGRRSPARGTKETKLPESECRFSGDHVGRILSAFESARLEPKFSKILNCIQIFRLQFKNN